MSRLSQCICQAKTVVQDTRNAGNLREKGSTPQHMTTRQQRKIQQQARKIPLMSPQGYTPWRSTQQNNPPFVALYERKYYKCLGCDTWVVKKDNPYSCNLIFMLKAICPYVHLTTQEWIHPEGNGFFHLDINCVQKHDCTIEMHMATITDDVFMCLTQQQLEFLNAEGILCHITTNKEKTL